MFKINHKNEGGIIKLFHRNRRRGNGILYQQVTAFQAIQNTKLLITGIVNVVLPTNKTFQVSVKMLSLKMNMTLDPLLVKGDSEQFMPACENLTDIK